MIVFLCFFFDKYAALSVLCQCGLPDAVFFSNRAEQMFVPTTAIAMGSFEINGRHNNSIASTASKSGPDHGAFNAKNHRGTECISWTKLPSKCTMEFAGHSPS
jgi:hypothetical protein